MTDREMIDAAKKGVRVTGQYSCFPDEVPTPDCNHWWRTIPCDGSDEDVVECGHCGKQRVSLCDFDSEYS